MIHVHLPNFCQIQPPVELKPPTPVCHKVRKLTTFGLLTRILVWSDGRIYFLTRKEFWGVMKILLFFGIFAALLESSVSNIWRRRTLVDLLTIFMMSGLIASRFFSRNPEGKTDIHDLNWSAQRWARRGSVADCFHTTGVIVNHACVVTNPKIRVVFTHGSDVTLRFFVLLIHLNQHGDVWTLIQEHSEME